MTDPPRPTPEVAALMERRRWLKTAATGTAVAALGGFAYYVLGDDDATRRARAQRLPDGRPRLPEGQRVLAALRPMGGVPGDPSPSRWRLTVTGAVERPLVLTFAELLALPQTAQRCDVHCVTGWSVLDSAWTGVRLALLAARVGVRPEARHVVFEAAHGYTANVPLREALAPEVLVAHRLGGEPLARPNGPPVRALVPALYFWKSAKWLTGVRFVVDDEPGYWETRGYHNHADPWREERYG